MEEVENWQNVYKILEIIKWPIVAIVIILILRKPLISLINKFNKIGYGGVSLEILQQTKAEVQEKKKASNISQALRVFRIETLEYFRNIVYSDIEFQKLNSESEKIDHLSDYAIIVTLANRYEFIYNTIFGSQIRLLKTLNSLSDENKESLKRFYQSGKEQDPKLFEDYSYEHYLEYLYEQKLILDEGSKVGITILGVDFLKYMIESNKSENKRF